MKEIKIVFKFLDPNSAGLYDTWFDIYIDGVKQERVKRFAIDLPAKLRDEINGTHLQKTYSYTLEQYVDLEEVIPEEWLG